MTNNDIQTTMKHFKSCEWVNAHLDELTLLDAGIVKAGEPGPYLPPAVIKHARRFDFGTAFADTTSQLNNTLCSPSQFEAAAQLLGLNQTDTIIVYDVQGLYASARALWMFKAMGFEDIYILDGGLTRWMSLGFPVQPNYSEVVKQGNFKVSYQTGYFIDCHQVLSVIDNDSHVILDARSPKRFTGEEAEPRAGMRSGHIPSSQNLHYAKLSQADGRVQPIDVLHTLFADHADKDKTLFFSCGSGVTACALAVAASECGYTSLSVYDGSWNEWGGDPWLPITTGVLS
ncbi:Thiosulfate sulfurtransferase, rhodanese [Pseudoalteromonas luteoviolacea B = ATCC 29581]|nr:Thiosulfate sulfurtransferase, rhodanese [Pseudoalteromonas luteoviolacea B = ATCC 29581]